MYDIIKQSTGFTISVEQETYLDIERHFASSEVPDVDMGWLDVEEHADNNEERMWTSSKPCSKNCISQLLLYKKISYSFQDSPRGRTP